VRGFDPIRSERTFSEITYYALQHPIYLAGDRGERAEQVHGKPKNRLFFDTLDQDGGGSDLRRTPDIKLPCRESKCH
jgi:hypothetical protein